MVFNQLQKVKYTEYEKLNFKYGAIRKTNNPEGVFDSKDKDLYREIAKFTIEYCQNELVATYGMKEVMIPENQHLRVEHNKNAKCKVFMTHDFHNPSE